MSNIMTSLWNVHSGMTINQSALNATAHNLANIDTKGYARQQILISDFDYKSIGYVDGQKMQVGLGAQIDTLRQLRNEFYDEMYRNENGRLGFYEAQYAISSDLEELFGELEGKTFQQTIEDIWISMEELAKEPEILATKTNFVNTVLDFLTRSKDIQKQIDSYQTGQNEKINEIVNRINQLGKEIYDINQKIYQVEAADVEKANDYRDQRNVLLDELGYYVNVDVFDDPSGHMQVNVEGQIFVTDMSVNKLKLEDVDEASPFKKPVWEKTGDDLYNPDKFYILNNNTSVGYLKGLLVARGTYKADYTNIPIKPDRPIEPTRVPATATPEEQAQYNEALAEYNNKMTQYENDMKVYEQEVEIYNRTVDTSVTMSVQAQFDNLIHGIVTALNDIFCPNIEVDLTEQLEPYKDDTKYSITFEGQNIKIVDDGAIPPTYSIVDDSDVLIDELKGIIKILDDEHAPVGDDKDVTQGSELISRNIQRYKTIEITNIDTGEVITKKVYVPEDPNDKKTLYSSRNLDINQDIKNNYSKLPINKVGVPGEYDYNGVVVKILDLWNQDFQPLDPNSLTTCNFKEYYNAFIFSLGGVANTFDDIVKGQTDAMQELDDSRHNFMGVSSDEELANLVKFQQSFNAAAKYYTTINDMLEYLIERLG